MLLSVSLNQANPRQAQAHNLAPVAAVSRGDPALADLVPWSQEPAELEHLAVHDPPLALTRPIVLTKLSVRVHGVPLLHVTIRCKRYFHPSYMLGSVFPSTTTGPGAAAWGRTGAAGGGFGTSAGGF